MRSDRSPVVPIRSPERLFPVSGVDGHEAVGREPLDQLDDQEFRRVPGLYRLWDLPVVMRREEDYRVDYAELTEEGAPLFAVYRACRVSEGAGQ